MAKKSHNYHQPQQQPKRIVFNPIICCTKPVSSNHAPPTPFYLAHDASTSYVWIVNSMNDIQISIVPCLL
eukprot:scaffold25970_cov155-Skeletonema_dohrnii-CCMP3373.AAC.5